MPNWKKVIISGSDAALNSLEITSHLAVTGSANILGDVTASAFIGDGSALTNITAEWDGSHNGDAEITGSLTITGTSKDITIEDGSLKLGTGFTQTTALAIVALPSGDGLSIKNGSMYLTAYGEVGIGTASPDAALGVQGDVRVGSNLYFDSVGKNGFTDTVDGLVVAGSGSIQFQSSDAVIGSQTERMRLTFTGLGIGTTTPTEKLTVEGNISGSGNVNILGDVTASAFIGDGSALTGITPTVADGSVTNIKLANDSVTIGTTEVDLGIASTTLAGLTDVKITGSLTVSGSGNTNILGTFNVYGASPSQELFSTTYGSGRVVSNWYDFGGFNLATEVDPGNITITSDFSEYLTLRNNGTTKGLSREDGTGRFTRLSFETGTITNDGVLTIPKDVTGTIALELKGYTVSTLPTGAVGDRAYVTDALTPSFLTSVTGGGAITSPVFHNGTIWVCG